MLIILNVNPLVTETKLNKLGFQWIAYQRALSCWLVHISHIGDDICSKGISTEIEDGLI